MSRYLNPFTDYGFKKLFGSKNSKAYLVDFLRHILPNKPIITKLTYQKTEHLGQSELDRKDI